MSGLPTRTTVEKIAQAMQCTTTETAELLAAAGRISEEMQAQPGAAAALPHGGATVALGLRRVGAASGRAAQTATKYTAEAEGGR